MVVMILCIMHALIATYQVTTRGLAVMQSLVQIGAEQSSGVEHVSLRRSGPLLRQQAQIFGQ